ECQTAAGVCAFVVRNFLRSILQDGGATGRRVCREVRAAQELSRPAERSGCSRTTGGQGSGTSIALPLVEDFSSDVHSDDSRGSNGDGALDRGACAFPRSSCCRGASFTAGEPEDSWHEG